MTRSPIHRRTLLKSTAAGAATLPLSHFAFAAPRETLRVGVVGCGGRGTGAAFDCINSSEGVEVYALGDLFEQRVNDAKARLAEHGNAIADERCFTGWDAFERVMDAGVDVVILATPPHFRPRMLRAAVERGLHVFMEKPVAVDGPGVRSVIESGEMAKLKGLAIVSGTQRRHQASYLATMQRIHDGEIGDIVGGQCWWNQGSLWMHPRQAEWSDMEWQLRNWLYFTWLSGDHICEQHIHNIDVMNWALGSTPVSCVGLGGRQVRTDPAYGQIFDHFSIEFEYPGGVLIQSSCRQIDNTASRVGERVVGTKGVADPGGTIRGATNWRYDGDGISPYQQEHADLIASIRAGEPLNEAKRVAESTLSAIMGRMSTYTGKKITFEQALNSTEDLSPPAYEFGDLAVAPVPMPGLTQFS
ncbi:Gfo/Idh/MocA family protein [Engelhardtia mirabilis]|uniref:Inositol 2-dehydrogenase n=1 Tax=Engelhardtia mirabilis TaxID=2528011 RepID=A0A518BF01_9BACT|nr:Inositol 2-dehydrogenase [Planctomycetes bacterium Pla133]QDU99868.1 Inositol 2-dehydrogenase [Planctomycetes bacterium Pla86]